MESNALQDIRANVLEKFANVRKLLEDHEKFKTEQEPYKLKYEAINVLKETEADLANALKNIPDEERGEELMMLAVVYLKLGLLHADTEELKAAEEQLTKCVEILKGRELDSTGIFPVLSALNQLGIIWSQWNQPSEAKAFLDRAEHIYNEFTADNNACRDSIKILTYFNIVDSKNDIDPTEMLEKIHTLTLYYLAQVYRSLKDYHKSAVYCHMTLRTQLGHKNMIEDLDYVDWALNAATLSQYFMENNGFSQARHHLAAASYILQKYERVLQEKSEHNNESEALAAEWEIYNRRSADVARCWAKYGILLLSMSKQRLLQKTENDVENYQVAEKENTNSKEIEDLQFEILSKELEPISNQVTDKYLLDFDDARPVFLNAQKWLEQAKTYYTLDNHASDYVLIAQDMSQAYKYLSFFEEHEDRQAKMHKRRVDILENVVKELNPQYYTSACRQIWIELGETYSDILDIKLDRLHATHEKPVPYILAKINRLAKSAITNFQMFIDSVQTGTSDTGIVQFTEDVLRAALHAYFYIGRLYGKILSSDRAVQLENTQNSINAYKFVIDYCEKYPKAAEVVKVELNLCKELVTFLSLKLSRLLRQDTVE